MAKRHASLVPLSRDHHDGLFLALRLKQGKRANLTGWSHDPRWQAYYVVAFYKSHLVLHFEAEEEILFPAMKRYAQGSERTIETLLQQHKEIKRTVSSFEAPDEKNLVEDLKNFGELLDQHIHIEENELFPVFEKSVPKAIAEEVGREIEKIKKPLSK